MELVSVAVENFKRFEELSNLRVNGKLVALVGPNEAGKTSLLNAISLIGSSESLSDNHKTYGGMDDAKITAKFYVPNGYLKEFNAEGTFWYELTKIQNNNQEHNISPRVPRDGKLRKVVERKIRTLLRSKTATNFLLEFYGEEALDTIKSLNEIFQEKKYKFGDEVFLLMEETLEYLNDEFSEKTTKSTSDLGENLRDLIEFEKEHNPEKTVLDYLYSHVPKFLEFSFEDRNLGIPFDVRQMQLPNVQNREFPNTALQRVIDLAELDLTKLATAMTARNTALMRGLLDAANGKLNEKLSGSWSQSEASIRFEATETHLDLIVAHPEFEHIDSKYVNFADRSDGYKQFTALAVFALLEGVENSILLIDEVETHLHYDAQADLIQILAKQSLCEKVIYTTHSAGCLPEDLGNGVRLIEWNKEKRHRSSIRNKFWSLGASQGFSPLLLGMGATTFSFFPSRNALVAEGISEMILLSSLMREAVKMRALSFQVVPGLSEVSNKQIPLMGASGKDVAYIVDNDKGGKDLEKLLLKNGVAPDRILKISNNAKVVTLEDCFKQNIWKTAVTRYVEMWKHSLGEVQIKSWPKTDRIKALPKTIRDAKVEIAYIIQDMIFENPDLEVLNPTSKKHFIDLVEKTHTLFEVH